MKQVAAERQKQWQQLVEMAVKPAANNAQSIEQSNQAKAVIYDILMKQGQPLATPGSGMVKWRGHEMLVSVR
jgi:hypothetical protein